MNKEIRESDKTKEIPIQTTLQVNIELGKKIRDLELKEEELKKRELILYDTTRLVLENFTFNSYRTKSQIDSMNDVLKLFFDLSIKKGKSRAQIMKDNSLLLVHPFAFVRRYEESYECTCVDLELGYPSIAKFNSEALKNVSSTYELKKLINDGINNSNSGFQSFKEKLEREGINL